MKTRILNLLAAISLWSCSALGQTAIIRSQFTTNEPVVATIDALRAFTGAGNTVFVSDTNRGGYFTASTTLYPTNAGTIYTNTGAARVWMRQFSGPLDIRWFGATTGATGNENATAIAAALAIGPSYIPPGTWTYTNDMKLYGLTSIELKGAGKDSILYFKPPADVVTNVVHAFWIADGTTNVLMKDFTLHGWADANGAIQAATTAYGAIIFQTNVHNVMLDGLLFRNFAAVGVRLQTIPAGSPATKMHKNFTIQNCEFDNIGTYGGQPDGGAIVPQAFNNLNISGCVFNNIGRTNDTLFHSIYAGDSGGTHFSSNIIVRGNSFWGPKPDIEIDATYESVVVGNVISSSVVDVATNTTFLGIFAVYNTNMVISANTLRGCNVRISASSNIVFNGNSVVYDTVGTIGGGLDLIVGTSLTGAGNYIYGDAYPILLENSSKISLTGGVITAPPGSSMAVYVDTTANSATFNGVRFYTDQTMVQSAGGAASSAIRFNACDIHYAAINARVFSTTHGTESISVNGGNVFFDGGGTWIASHDPYVEFCEVVVAGTSYSTIPLRIDNLLGVAGTTIAFNTNSFVLYGGNVGVGTNAPVAKLEVEGNRTGAALKVNGTQLVVTNGAVGIATATPSATLHVQGQILTSTSTPSVSFTDSSAGEDDWSISVNADNFTINNVTQGTTPLTIVGGGVDALLALLRTDSDGPAIKGTTNSTTYTATGTPRISVRNATDTDWIPLVAKSIFLDDAAATAGNARGVGAVDLQPVRSAATQIASGISSMIAGGTNNTASGNYSFAAGVTNRATGASSVAIGTNNMASGIGAVALGNGNSASGAGSMASGNGNTASGLYSTAFGVFSVASSTGSSAFGNTATATAAAATGIGNYSAASLASQLAIAAGRFHVTGDSQTSFLNARRSIQTNGVAAGTGVGLTNAWNPLFLDGDSGAQRMVLPYTAATQTNTVWTFEVKASAFATTNATPANVMYAAGYTATGVIKETVVGGTRTTALVGSPVYVAWEDAGCAAAWDIRVVANDTTDSLDVEFYPGDDCPKVSATITLNQLTVGP